MYSVLTAAEVRAAEAKAIAGGYDQMLLRFNAALAVADGIYAEARREWSRTAVFCGPGGNGYDGIIVASRLKQLGCEVALYLTDKKTKYNCGALQYAQSFGLELNPASKFAGGATIIIDAIFGIGLSREITGETAALIERINELGSYKLAVDIPSGLNADTGEVMGVAVKANETVTFSCYKRGMLFAEGRDYCGKVRVAPVGIECSSDIKVFDESDFTPIRRKKTMHKGLAGKIFVIGGSGNMIGAPILASAAAHAAYLNGAGTVTMCLPSIHRAGAVPRAAMSMLRFLPDTKDGFIKFDKASLDDIISTATSIDIGMGMGAAPDLKEIVRYLSDNFAGVLVLDADALNAIKLDYAFLKNSKAKVILTPHAGEFKRLTDTDMTIENAVKLARDTGAVVVSKSSTTIITDGNEIRVNVTGTPAMAKGGMGDVLGGSIAGLACTFGAFDAACVACYRNGLGAERAVSSYAELMLTARDVINYAGYDEV